MASLSRRVKSLFSTRDADIERIFRECRQAWPRRAEFDARDFHGLTQEELDGYAEMKFKSLVNYRVMFSEIAKVDDA